jgi:hypothetical protein
MKPLHGRKLMIKLLEITICKFLQHLNKIFDNFNRKEERNTFIEEASYFGQQSPHAIYDSVKFVSSF